MRWTIALVDVATLALPAQAAAQSTPVEDATLPYRRYRCTGLRGHLLAAVLRPGER